MSWLKMGQNVYLIQNHKVIILSLKVIFAQECLSSNQNLFFLFLIFLLLFLNCVASFLLICFLLVYLFDFHIPQNYLLNVFCIIPCILPLRRSHISNLCISNFIKFLLYIQNYWSPKLLYNSLK